MFGGNSSARHRAKKALNELMSGTVECIYLNNITDSEYKREIKHLARNKDMLVLNWLGGQIIIRRSDLRKYKS